MAHASSMGESEAAPNMTSAIMQDLPARNLNQEGSASQPRVLYAQAERVHVKETAVRKAIASLQKIARLVSNMSIPSSEPDLSSWSFLVNAVAHDNDAFEFLVGMAGDTGIGKSSLLNALVSETADVAPSSQNGACTAAVCCFSQPRSQGASPKTYAAHVQLKTQETVDQELVAFFQEFNEFEERVQLAGGEDSVTYGEREKLNDYINLIRGWSGLSRQQIEELGLNNMASYITSSCKDKEQLFHVSNPQRARVLKFANDDASKFLQDIKPYVGSAGRSQSLARWPLVEKVEIFLEADLLHGGIVLVDLPGEMDALDARSQVARRYYNKLDSLMVVTPGDRAIDNRTAMELIRDDQILDMEADGMIHEHGLCVVVSKADLMDWRNFVETEYSSEDISPDFPKLLQDLRGKEGEKLALKRRIEVLEVGGDGSNDELNTLLHLETTVAKEMAELDSQCLRRCIDARNKDIRTAFEHYFDRIRNSARAKQATEVSTGLKVISVSSKAYRSLARGRPEPAFGQAEFTGIDALKAWIIEGSLQKREEHADTILGRCQVLFDAIDGWATEETYVGITLPDTERADIRRALARERERLKRSLLAMIRNFGAAAEQLLLEASLCKHESDNQGLAARFVPHVDHYQKAAPGASLHWSTYAACIRRRGGAFCTYARPRKTHCWQARLYGLLWSAHVHRWGPAYGQNLGEKITGLDQRLQKRIARHLTRTAETEAMPTGLRSALRGSAYRVENIFAEYRYRAKDAVRGHRATARATKQGSRKLLADKMEEAYKAADAITGKGKLKRQTDTMHQYAEKMKDTIFAETSREIDEKLSKERVGLKKKLREETTKVMNEISKIEDKICASCGKQPKKQASSPDVDKAKKAISRHVREWKQYWANTRAQFPPTTLIIDDDSVESDGESEPKGAQEFSSKTCGKKRAGKGPGEGPRKAPKKKGGNNVKGVKEKTRVEATSTSKVQPSVVGPRAKFKTELDE